MDLKDYQDKLRNFADKRDWHRFHTPDNLAKSIAIEAGELLECFQWEAYKGTATERKNIGEEIADVMIYLLILADKTGLDIEKCVQEKIKQNGVKYPAVRP